MTNLLCVPHSLRGLFAALIFSFPQLQAEPAAVSTSDGVSGTKGKSQQMTSPDQVPEGLAKSDWQGIRAAREAGRHAFQPVQGKAGHWQARNPGQQWHTTFDQRGFMTSPLGGGWTWGLELESYGFGEKQTSISGTPQVEAEGQRLAYQWDATVQEWFVNDQRGLEHGFTLAERPAADPAPGSQPTLLSFTLSTRGGLTPKVASDSVQFLNATGTTVLNYSGLKVWDADGKTLPAHFEPAGVHGFRLLVEESTARYPITIDPVAQQAYLKASNTKVDDRFGYAVAVDGDTAVVGAPQDLASPADSGAAYVFIRSAGVWSQQAILEASNAGASDSFGVSVAVDGDTIIVGAWSEDSSARTVNGDGSNDSAPDSGAAYVFTRTAGVWTEQAYLKASNADLNDRFGYSVDLSGDTVVVGAWSEGSNATTVNGNAANNSATSAGAAYVFTRSAGTWTQQAYLKASNSAFDDNFGWAVAVDGDTVVVGAPKEDSNATTVNGNGADNTFSSAGAAYVFIRSAGVWTQQAYLKATNSGPSDQFGYSVDVSGNTVVIGAIYEASNSTIVNGNGSNNSAPNSGAAYVFTRSVGTWTQQAYLKADNSGVGDNFGTAVAVDGDVVVVGAQSEDGSSTGINGTSDNLVSNAGAAYVFVRSSGTWSQQSYLKASQVSQDDFFSRGVAASGGTVVVGANNEDSSSTGINSTPNEGASNSGAAYIFSGLGPVAPAPTVTNVSPSTGSTLGGTSVVITGTDFTDATAVTFGGTNATSFTVNSATQITATTPAGTAGTASVLVTTAGGTNAANTLYTYVIPQATVTSVNSSSPNGTYMPGNSVSITVAFSENVTVTGTPTLTLETGTTDQTASFDSVSGSEMTFVYNVQLGDSATDLDYISNAALSLNSGTILATADGSPANLTLPAPGSPGSLGANKNIVIRTPVPVVSYVESDTGLTSGGASVSIYGGPFFGSTTVTFGGVPATNVSVTGSRIFCTTPAHSFGPVNVEVTTPAGTSEPNTAFTYYNTTLTGGWASNNSGIPVVLHNVHFVNASTGWASGASGMIHKSTDGGVTWTSQSSSQTEASFNPLYGLTFADANTGWASSGMGTLIKTTDGGDNWLQQSPSTGQQIWTVFARTPTTAWIAGSAGMIGRTTDGTNWTSSENNPPGNPNTGLNDIQFVDANNGYAIAGGGWSAKTTDGGATWTQMPGALPNGGVSNSYRLAALSFVDVNTGWAVGSQGTIIKTTDGGATWATQNSGVLTQTLHSVSFVDANKGWAVGDTGIILQTVNGGTTWTVVNSGTGFVFLDVHFIDETTGWVVGDFGRVLRYSAPQVAPVVSLVSPASGTTEGGSVVTITGTNFTNASAVTFGGTNATSFTVNSATQITAVTPAGSAGTASVLVTTPGGTNAANTLFTYVAPPTVTNVSPATGSSLGGTSVVITGTNFTGASAVTFGGTNATSFTVNSATQITAVTPAGSAGAVSVLVTTAGGTNAANTLFTYVAPPTVTNVSPALGSTAGGTSITLTGTGFTGATSVTIGGTAASRFRVFNATTITATTPAGTAGTASVLVTTAGGTNAANTLFTYFVPNSVPSFNLPLGDLGPAGMIWTQRTSGFDSWNDITSSADGSKLAAVIFGGQIYTSADSGVTWTARESSRNWTSITSSADGTKLAATVGPGQIFTSTDSGVTWTARESSRSWTSIASSSDGSKLAATTIAGPIYTSTDSGATWTARASGSFNWQTIASSADGSKLVAGVYGGQVYTSTDSGVTWTARDSSRNWDEIASSTDGSKLAAVVFGGQIYTSTDSGVTWVARDSNRNWNSIASSADGSKLVATVSFDLVYISGDSGVTWTAQDTSRRWTAVTSSADGSKLAAGVNNNRIYTSVPAPLPPVVKVVVGSGTSTTPNFAFNISPGPASDNGQTVSFTVTNNNNALFTTQPAIANDGTLTFTPGNTVGSAIVTVTAVDDGGTAAGGVDSSVAQTFTIQVSPAAPTVTNVAPATGSTLGGTVVTITGTDFTDATAVTFGGTNATSFTVNSATQITAATPAQAAGAVSVEVTTAGGTNAANTLFTYVVPNFAPVITSNGGDATASINVAENSTAVTTVTATDADLPAQTLTYTKSGVDAAFFTLDSATGALSFTSPPNFEAPADSGLNNIYDVTVTVTDSGTPSLFDSQDLSIIVTNVNESPAIKPSSSYLAYETVNPTRNNSGLIVYTANNAATLAAQPFNRVRYRMENTTGGVAYFADASFDAWGGLTVAGLKVPDAGNILTTQRNVTNVSIRSNHPRVVNSNTELGRLEHWTNNYATPGIIGGSGTVYDYDDTPQTPVVGYGSFQLHNLSATVPETVFAWNNHSLGAIPEVGFGNATIGIHPDWTFTNTGTNAWRMQIYIENNFVPPTMSFTEDVTGNILFFNSPFQDNDSTSLTVTLAVADGTVTGNPGTGITVGGTAISRTFTGSVADLNAYFTTPGKVTYLGALNNTVSRTLTVTVSDGSLSTNTTSTLHLAPVNDAPAVAATLTDASWTPTAAMSVARIYHTATRLADGRVLVAGGTNGTAQASAQIFDPVLGTWTATGSMVSARQLHKAVRLANGKVLVAGGYDAGGVSQTSELYDPATGTWTASGILNTPRVDYTMTLLADGRVLIAGGRNSSFRVATAEIYNPATNTWTATGNIAVTRWSHTAALLPDGQVLIAGGDISNNATVQTASAEIYNPVTGTWSSTAAMTVPRYEHAMETLPDGRVMVAGGFNGNSTLASAEIYNPSTATWSMTGSMTAGRGYTSLTPLSDGRLLISGGRQLSPSTFLASAEIYNPTLGTWTTTSTLGASRQLHASTALADGRVLVTGGSNAAILNGAEIFAPRVAGAEGATLTQTGTFSDVDGTATVTLTASSGTVTQNNTLGTWSWSPAVGFDGPSSSNVTITATDSSSAVAKAVFTFAPTNAVPTVQINPPTTLVTNVALNFQFVATDAATADQAAGFAWSINFGDGSSVLSVPAGTATPLTRSHTYTQSGTYVVTATATDKDGGVSIAATASVTILGSEIAVSGNGNVIVDGDSTPALADHTDFGSVSVSGGSISRSFTIANSGSAALNLTGTAPNYVTISGSTDFIVTTQPTTPIAATSGSTTFVVTFNPSSGGIKNAMVNIANDDLDETPYNFAITGEGQMPEPIPSALGDVVTAGDAPGANGTTNIGEFSVLRRGGFLAENGHLVFPGFLQVGSGSPAVTAANASGIWKTASGNLFLVARTGTVVPDLPGTQFATVPEVPGLSETGEVTMLSSLVIGSGVTTANDTGVWSEIGGGGLRLLLREDDNVPSLAGVKVGAFASGVYATARTGASAGEAVFSVTYKGASTKTALLRTSVSGATTTVSVVAQEGEVAPGASPAANYVSVAGSYSDPGRMDAQGNFVYSALTTPGNKEGIWYQPVTGGIPNKVFFAGETAPGTGGATFARLQRPSMGSNGFISFRATLNRDGDNAANARNDGIWNGSAANPASFTCVLRRGDGVAKVSNLPVGSLVGNPWGGWLTNSNLGAWRAWLDVDGDGISSTADGDVNAIFANLSGAMQLAVKVGDAAPGTAGATFSGFDLPIVGGSNQYAILGNLTGGDTVVANNQGLWKSGPNGGALTLAMRKGETILTTEGPKVVTKIDVPGSNQTDRRWEQPVMDSAGRMVVYVTFADGSTSQVIVP